MLKQANFRIDSEVKSAGDAIIESYGMTPSQIMRQVWGYIAETGTLPTFITEVQEPSKALRSTGAGETDMKWADTPAASANAENAVAAESQSARDRAGLVQKLISEWTTTDQQAQSRLEACAGFSAKEINSAESGTHDLMYNAKLEAYLQLEAECCGCGSSD